MPVAPDSLDSLPCSDSQPSHPLVFPNPSSPGPPSFPYLPASPDRSPFPAPLFPSSQSSWPPGFPALSASLPFQPVPARILLSLPLFSSRTPCPLGPPVLITPSPSASPAPLGSPSPPGFPAPQPAPPGTPLPCRLCGRCALSPAVFSWHHPGEFWFPAAAFPRGKLYLSAAPSYPWRAGSGVSGPEGRVRLPGERPGCELAGSGEPKLLPGWSRRICRVLPLGPSMLSLFLAIPSPAIQGIISPKCRDPLWLRLLLPRQDTDRSFSS